MLHSEEMCVAWYVVDIMEVYGGLPMDYEAMKGSRCLDPKAG